MADNVKKAALTDDRPLFTWKANEFAVYQKNFVWFLLALLVAAVLCSYFIWAQSWTAAGVVIAGVLALLSTSRLTPKKISCGLYRDGVVIEEKAYRFADLKSFWMIDGQHPMVRFARPGRFSTAINMPIAEEDPEQVRLFLSKYLPEEENRGEDVADVISRWIKF